MKKFALWILLSFAILGVSFGGIFTSPSLLNFAENLQSFSVHNGAAENLQSRTESLQTVGTESVQNGVRSFFYSNVKNGKNVGVQKTSVSSCAAAIAAENVQKISTAQELFDFVSGYSASSQNANIVLTADIDLAQVSDGGVQSVLSGTIGTQDAPFFGSFDGQGYTIRDLKISLNLLGAQGGQASLNGFAGLFGVAEGATIKNVSIENANVSIDGCTNAYVGGVIGRATNCLLSGLGVSGNVNLSAGGASLASVGGVAGKIVECQNVMNVQNLGYTRLNNNMETSCTLEYGALFGNVQDCQTLNSLLARATLVGNLSAANAFTTQYVGAVAGKFAGGQVQFAVVQTNFSISVFEQNAQNFALGGVVGALCQGSSQLKNVAVENAYVFADAGLPANAVVGEIAGVVQNQVPVAGNISFVHYKQNTIVQNGQRKILSVFGDKGAYLPKVPVVSGEENFSGDNVTATSESLGDLRVDSTGYAYFSGSSLAWDPFSPWNFDEIWRVGAGENGQNNMFLQNFYNMFIVRVANVQNSEIISFDTSVFDERIDNDTQNSGTVDEGENDDQEETDDQGGSEDEGGSDDPGQSTRPAQYSANFRFAETVKLRFSFKNNSTTQENMNEYYKLASLSFAPADTTKKNQVYEIFSSTDEQGNISYSFSKVGSSRFSIRSIDDKGEQFEIEISGVCQATAGTYGIETKQITKSVQVTSKLYGKDGRAIDEIENDQQGHIITTPATITQTGTSRAQESVDVQLSYNRSRRVTTIVRPNKPYAFLGWFVLLKGQSFDDVRDAQQLNPPAAGLNASQNLELIYGKTNLFASENVAVEIGSAYCSDDIECIFAKYTISAYNLAFVLGEGVQKVDLFDGSVSVTESTKNDEAGVAVSKNEPSLIMEIYIESSVTFNPELFISSFNTYNTSDDENFCQLLRSTVLDNGVNYYRFKFDMAKYKTQTTYGDTIQVNVATTIKPKEIPMWIWWVIGGVGGLIVLLLVVAIVLIIKRHRGNGPVRTRGPKVKTKAPKQSFKKQKNFF